MTPFQLAQEHRCLWHVTAAEAVDSILERGLMSTADILDLWEVKPEEKERHMTRRRERPALLAHRAHGTVVINDNAPLNEKKLASSLDDGLTTSEWLRMLSSRVFFFAGTKARDRLIGAAMNVGRPKKVLVIDTRRLAEAYGDAMEIVPINSGNTNYAPARRGHATFAPLVATDYDRWRWQRGKKQPDTIKGVAVRCSLPDIARFVKGIHDGVPA